MSDSESATIVLAATATKATPRMQNSIYSSRRCCCDIMECNCDIWKYIVMGLLPACMVLISKVLFAVIEGSFKL